MEGDIFSLRQCAHIEVISNAIDYAALTAPSLHKFPTGNTFYLFVKRLLCHLLGLFSYACLLLKLLGLSSVNY